LLREHYRALDIIEIGVDTRTFLAIDEDKPSKPYCLIKQFFPLFSDTNLRQKVSDIFEKTAVFLDELEKIHPQIPKLLAYFTQDNRQYLVQEYIEGKSLYQELEENGVFTEQKVRDLLVDILTILQLVHANEVIHENIKPMDIIRRNLDGKFVLIDFSKAIWDREWEVDPERILPKNIFQAPEKAFQGKAIFASDLYSLGVTCIYCLIYSNRGEIQETWYNQRWGNYNDWEWRDYLGNNYVSDELGKILDKLICFDSRERYQTAAEVLQDLNATSTTEKQKLKEQDLNATSTTEKQKLKEIAKKALALIKQLKN